MSQPHSKHLAQMDSANWRPPPSSQEWEFHKPTFERLFREKMKMKDVKRYMESEHDFFATKYQYHLYLNTKWGLKKYASEAIWRAVAPRISALTRRGQAFEVWIHAEIYSPSRVRKAISRLPRGHRHGVTRGKLPPLPPGVVIRQIASGPTLSFLMSELPFERFENHLRGYFGLASTTLPHKMLCTAAVEIPKAGPNFGSREDVITALQAIDPPGEEDTGTERNVSSLELPQIFTCSIYRSLVWSIANNFAGIEFVPKWRVFKFLRGRTSKDVLMSILSAQDSTTAQAIRLNLFKATIEVDEAEFLSLLLSTSNSNELAQSRINVDGREYMPLQRAAELGNGSAIVVLLKNGAHSPFAQDIRLMRPWLEYILDLYVKAEGCWYDDPESTIKELLNAGATPKASTIEFILEDDLLHHMLLPLLEEVDSQVWVDLTTSGRILSMFKELGQQVLIKILALLVKNKIDLNYSTRFCDNRRNPTVIIDTVALSGCLPLMRHICAAGAKTTADTLSFGISSGQEDIVRFLLNDPTCNIRMGRRELTPLGAALRGGKDSIMRIVRSNERVMDFEERLGFEFPLCESLRLGYLALVQDILHRYKNLDPKRLGRVLECALAHRHREIALMLIEAGADVNGSTGSRPIFRAFEWGDRSVIRTLLDEDAVLNYHTYNDYDGNPEPVINAVSRSGDTTLIRIFVDAGGDLNPKRPSKAPRGPLGIAISEGNKEMFEYLVRSGCYLELAESQYATSNNSLLFHAAHRGDHNWIQLVLEYGADPEDPCALSYLIMHLSSLPQADETINLWLDRYRKRYGDKHPWGSDISCQAIQADRFDLFKKGLRFSGDPAGFSSRKWFYRECEDGALLDHGNMSPFGCAVAWSSDQTIGLKYAKYLLQNRSRHFGNCHSESIVSDTTSHDNDNPVSRCTAFLLAIETEYVPVVKLLLEDGADVNYPAELGVKRTPLQKAAEMGSIEMVQLLLDRGAEVNAPAARRGGGTALQLAALHGYLDVVRLLLDRHADVNAEKSRVNGSTALEAAAEHGRLDIVKVILLAMAYTGRDSKEQVADACRLAELKGWPYIVKMLKTFGRDGVAGLEELTSRGSQEPRKVCVSHELEEENFVMSSGEAGFDEWVDFDACDAAEA